MIEMILFSVRVLQIIIENNWEGQQFISHCLNIKEDFELIQKEDSHCIHSDTHSQRLFLKIEQI